ncbi:MAG TPA: class I SAM-dependent methyltransferase [Nocardioides sp.]|uniref:class I SAM-dependent methyltransferase n=1 Tax=Nocardioides sp. TaxID=35761 RepID=UPI002ED896ED
MPTNDGMLDEVYLDRLALRIHYELQRLGEELQLDRRVAALLAPWIARLQAAGRTPVRVVDVGCGLGHVIRAAAAHRHFPPGVELVGVDLNRALVNEARRLASVEQLDCNFIAGDAFAPGVAINDPSRTIVISTGLLHHLDLRELVELFSVQARLGVAGFAHWDIAPCVWSTVGAWVFHQARMREPVSRHDGVMSARRAHCAEALLAAAHAGAPEYAPSVIEGSRWHPRAIDVLRPITGWKT